MFRRAVFVFILVFGAVSIFAQEGRYIITGDDVSSQLRWMDLHTGEQFSSLAGVTSGITTAQRTGAFSQPRILSHISNQNNYAVTVLYINLTSGTLASAMLQPKGNQGDRIDNIEGDILLLRDWRILVGKERIGDWWGILTNAQGNGT